MQDVIVQDVIVQDVIVDKTLTGVRQDRERWYELEWESQTILV
ncbi:hypothetical protein [Thermoleptolyngbya sp. PKUAC-SCTB121]|nr:hypothetical protein [Thermoleptolyngbya sp. PKUAC-SCTB121]